LTAVMRAVLVLLGLCGAAAGAWAQQPFVSDDAEVTARSNWHFEYFNEYAALSRNDLPDLRQDTNNFVIQYGLLENLEVNLDFPLIAITRERNSQLGSAFGLGDVDFAAKYKLVKEDPNGIRPAFTMSAAVELPTGKKSTQLGSGYTDVVLNTIAQKTFSEKTVLHLNLGYQVSGNTLTGAIGIRTPGHILTAGLSAAHIVSRTLLLGIDLNGAQIRTASTLGRQLQLTSGGSYAIKEGMTLDFALLRGWYSGPRVGLLLGMSYTP
jgi:Putative MetA-pathway of phenol degradation